MFAVSLINKNGRMLFSKHATMREAKEKVREELKYFTFAEIYDQTSKEIIRKDGIGSEWRKVDEQ